jgi:hypothetical protein
VAVKSAYRDGSGVLITPRHVLTCKHVVCARDEKPFDTPKRLDSTVFIAGDPHPASLIWDGNASLDAAVLELKEAVDTEPVRIPGTRNFRRIAGLKTATAFAMPEGEPSHWDTQLRDPEMNGPHATCWRSSFGLPEGASGGPVVARGRQHEWLIGLIQFGGKKAAISGVLGIAAFDKILEPHLPDHAREDMYPYAGKGQTGDRIRRTLEVELVRHAPVQRALATQLGLGEVDVPTLVDRLMSMDVPTQAQVAKKLEFVGVSAGARATVLRWLLSGAAEARWLDRHRVQASTPLGAAGALGWADDAEAAFVRSDQRPGAWDPAGVAVVDASKTRPLPPYAFEDAQNSVAAVFAERVLSLTRPLQSDETPLRALKTAGRRAESQVADGAALSKPRPWAIFLRGVLQDPQATMTRLEHEIPGLRCIELECPEDLINDDDDLAELIRQILSDEEKK